MSQDELESWVRARLATLKWARRTAQICPPFVEPMDFPQGSRFLLACVRWGWTEDRMHAVWEFMLEYRLRSPRSKSYLHSHTLAHIELACESSSRTMTWWNSSSLAGLAHLHPCSKMFNDLPSLSWRNHVKGLDLLLNLNTIQKDLSIIILSFS